MAGEVTLLIKSPENYKIKTFLEINLKNSYEFEFKVELTNDEEFMRIEQGKYHGSLLFLVTNKNQIISFNYKK